MIQNTQNVSVIVRLRPLLRFESEPAWMVKHNSLVALHSHSRSNKMASNQSLSSSKEGKDIQHQFLFESIIKENETSQQLYKKHIKNTLLECCQKHKNMAMMAYGQTCSGKTHTILGIKEAPGIIPCVLRELLLRNNHTNSRFKVSYLEIYNQKIRDLLDRKANDKQMQIVKDSKWGCDVSGTAKEAITSFQDGIRMLERGEKERQYGQGQHHQGSSRSHTLFRIFIEEWDSNFVSSSYSITLVDLAGSERLVSQNQTPSETKFINKSLFQLAHVISKLAEGSQHIPYRNSKLTRILEPSLSDRGSTIFICCVSPSMHCYGETLSTLRLAERAKEIKLPEEEAKSSQSDAQSLKELVRQKNRECSDLKKQIQTLNAKIASQQQLIKSLGKGSDKPVYNVKTLILFDHQNFCLFLNDTLHQLSPSRTAPIREAFVSTMQHAYQNYTDQILSLCCGDSFQLKIEQICFMNMVLQHQKIAEYKLTVIDQIIKERDMNGIESEANEQFYLALRMYRQSLLKDIELSNVSCCFDQSSMNSNRKGIDSSIRNTVSEMNQESSVKKIQFSLNIRHGERASEILTWGSKKDYRVCKGQICPLGMTKINNISNVTAIACGYHHTLAVTAEGIVYGWGKNTEKQLIASSKSSVSSPTLIKGLFNVKDVAAGWGHSLALTNDGLAYSWGWGKDGQLGHNEKEDLVDPTQIQHSCQIIGIYAGHSHSAFIDINKDLYTFGFNQDYRCLIGDEKILLQPRRVPIRDVREAALGLSHSAIVNLSGSVYCGGVGTCGQLGLLLDQNQAGWQKLEVIDRQFQQETYEKISPLVQVEMFNSNNKASRVYCGESSTFVLTQASELWSFGKPSSGRTGHNKPMPTMILQNIEMVRVGNRHGFALNKKQNKLYSWGFNLYGQANSSIAGDIGHPELVQQLPDKEIMGIGCGFFHSVILFK